MQPDLSTPSVLPPLPPYPYQPVEETYTAPVGAWTATWGVRRLASGEVTVTVTVPDDPAFERYSNGVTFYFDAAGKLTEAYGYGTGRLKNRQLKLPKKGASAVYYEHAMQMRQRLLAEPLRHLPILARYASDGGARYLLLAAADKGHCEIINLAEDEPNTVIRWTGYGLDDTLEQATPTRQDLTWEFFSVETRDMYDRLVLAPLREARRVAELTAQACANVAGLPGEQRKLLREMGRRQDHTARLDEDDPAQMEAARQIEANGWGQPGHARNHWLASGEAQLQATPAGQQVIEALAALDARERARRPFEHENFESRGGAGLTAADWRALFDRPAMPLVTQTRPMFGGTFADYQAWLARLPNVLAKAAAAYRAALLEATRTLHPSAKALNALGEAARQWNTARAKETGREARYVQELGPALHGLEAEISAAPQPALPPLRPASKIKTFPGGLAPARPTPRQRAALEWPCEAKESFAGWLGRMAAPPQAIPLDTPEAVTRQSGLWSEWEARQRSILGVLAYLDRTQVRTDASQAFNVRAWLGEFGWSWTADSVHETFQTSGCAQAAQAYASDERPTLLCLTPAETALYRAMAGQALGQVLGFESADFWDEFRLIPFSGQPDIVLEDSAPARPIEANPEQPPQPVQMRGQTLQPSTVTVGPEPGATYVLRCNGLGLLTLQGGGAPVTLTWLGGEELTGEAQAVACACRLFGLELKRRRPGKVWTATATGNPA